MTKYLLITIFVISFLCGDTSWGYTRESALYTHFTYIFQHASLLHLIVNSSSFLALFRAHEKITPTRIILSISITSAVIASFFTAKDIPTIGASGMIYAMIGSLTSLLIKKKAIIKKRLSMFVFLLGTSLSLTISLFQPNSNFSLHLLSMILGATITFLTSKKQ